MNLYAIGDLHLSGFMPKPMDVFGEHWNGHWDKIKESWLQQVSEGDVVLLPGDLSWAMRLNEARTDIAHICEMPGTKVLIKGNHDYWWGSLAQVNSLLFGNTTALQNNSLVVGDYVIAGTRGWLCPGNRQYSAETDEKLYMREAGRLELSLSHARKAAPDKTLIGMIHYPPSDQDGSPTLFTDLFEKYGASQVVYGHLHAASIKGALSGTVRGVIYTLVSCDATQFSLCKLV
jgi:predicted phosphohydrolase